jgi:hypothetical protein
MSFPLGSGKLVDFGNHGNGRNAVHAKPLDQLKILLGWFSPDIEEKDHESEIHSRFEICLYHSPPTPSYLVRNLSKAISWQIHQGESGVHKKEVEESRFARR